ncbi:putative TPR-repeat-containing chaperone protein DNAJ [Trypanosoma theileri]|uniref:Putative TPR-repeat-containing chaperone protein DNAJ n=1 Tax=Trypanosoma theileri TaxID=67003 RepID=A0A1X0P8B2_9TRYP|nr:putative TPR-repeat-containing chaperone protein DNAJ [Trypanosoma theileri]ORC93162.1 putative TPR-repeat-containing chaperone protein DNAJ [Trypanosoma theileri]
MSKAVQNEESESTLQGSELREEGNKAFKNGDFDAAIDLYTKAIEVNPQEVALFSNRSAAYIKKRSFSEAARDAEAAIAIDPTFAKAYFRLHNALCNLGRFDEAARRLLAGVKALEAASAPTEDIRHLRELHDGAVAAAKATETARRLLSERQPDAAAQALGPTAHAFPECAPVAFLLAEARAPRHPDEVTRALMPFALTHQSDPAYLYVRALASYYRGQDGFKTAQTILRQTLGLDPDNLKISALLKKIRVIESQKENGNSAFKEKRYKDAIEAYAAAIDMDPSNLRMVATLRGNQAAAKMELKEYSSALLDCDFAIANGMDSAKLYARRGRIQEALENYDDAVRDIQRAAEMDDSYSRELNRIKANAKRAKRKDYYKILGLSPNEGDESSIKRAYKKACLQWHPDKWANASEEERLHAEKMFKEVGEAFSILSDPKKKRMYDNGQLDNAVEGASEAQFSNFDAEMMNMMFGGGFGGFSFPRGAHQGGFGFSDAQSGFRQPGFTFRF